jgi:hypothetical protein
MRMLVLSSLLMIPGVLALGQQSSQLFDKAPPPIDEALRARVDKFYGAFVAGKFKEAYLLVADDSQDKFIELPKDQYKSCEITKIRYSDNFSKAIVVTGCKGDFRWRGTSFPETFPLTSNWEIIDGQWLWHYIKPTMLASPFSPTGFVPIPSGTSAQNAPVVPGNIVGTAQGILSKVSVDKSTVRLRSFEASEDVVHVRNEMPGPITLKLDALDMPGLKVTLGKTQLQAHEETTVKFEWRLDDPEILCVDCAKKMSGNPVVTLHIEPTAQVFPIHIAFEHAPQTQHPDPPQALAPNQK